MTNPETPEQEARQVPQELMLKNTVHTELQPQSLIHTNSANPDTPLDVTEFSA